jgi:hypothetical protein
LTISTNYDWQQRYEAAILETDRSLLPKRIAEAQAAIDQRVAELRSQQLSNNNNDGFDRPAARLAEPRPAEPRLAEEEQAIADALAGIRILIKEIG